MSEADQELARDLGFLEARAIGVGTMIGAGIFVLSIAANQARPASVFSFFVDGEISLLTAPSLPEQATGMPTDHLRSLGERRRAPTRVRNSVELPSARE